MLGQEFMRQLVGVARESARQSERILSDATPQYHEVISWGREDIDIANEQDVMEKISALKPSVIFNCAAYNNVDKAEDELEIANAINGEAVGYIASAAGVIGATLVHFSTDYVFGGNLPLTESYAAAHDSVTAGYTEQDLPDPISAYGQSKALGEQRILNNLITHQLNNFYIIRTSKLFGPPGIGGGSKKSFPEMMLGFAREKGRIEAIDGEVGSPTYVRDLVEATLELAGVACESARRRSLSAATPGIYHITNSGSCTWYEYAKAAVEYAGVQAEVVPVGADRFPRKAKRPACVVLINTKLQPLRSWQDALREFLVQG